MKIRFIVIGKTDETWLQSAIAKYHQRIQRYLPYEYLIIPDIKNRKNRSEEQQKIQEEKLILKNIKADEMVILLDEGGKEFTSVGFANFIQKKMNAATRTLTFVVGGPYGFSENIYSKYKQTIALSKMTFSHQMIRLIFTEQLYRALSILNNEPYHHS